MIVLKHVQYIEFAYGMKHYKKWNEALSKGTCDTTHFENYSLQKKSWRCLNCWTKSKVNMLSNNLETTHCLSPTSIRDSNAFPVFAPPPLLFICIRAVSLSFDHGNLL